MKFYDINKYNISNMNIILKYNCTTIYVDSVMRLVMAKRIKINYLQF